MRLRYAMPRAISTRSFHWSGCRFSEDNSVSSSIDRFGSALTFALDNAAKFNWKCFGCCAVGRGAGLRAVSSKSLSYDSKSTKSALISELVDSESIELETSGVTVPEKNINREV